MLDFIWVARFANGDVIKQFEDPMEQTRENAFKSVLDRHDELDRFALVSVRSGDIYMVNMVDGTLSFMRNGETEPIPDDDMLCKEQPKYRLIYFRRVLREFSFDLKELNSPKVSYFLGVQYTDRSDKNHKRLVKIVHDGRLVIV